MIGGQKIQVGLANAPAIRVEADTYQVTAGPGITIASPRTTSRDIRRRKASNYNRDSWPSAVPSFPGGKSIAAAG